MTATLPTDGLMLGIETSCDDTGVAVVRPDGEVVAAAVASQVELHDRYGGVYPEMASRAHVDAILPTVRQVLSDADLRPADLTAIGVTRGPGLIGVARRRDQQRRRARRRLGTPGLRRQPPPRAPAQRRPRRTSRRLPGHGPAGLGRAHTARAPARSGGGPARRLHPRRLGGGGLRQGRPHARAALPGRAGDRQAGQEPVPRTCPSRARRWTSSWTSRSRAEVLGVALPRGEPGPSRTPTWPRRSWTRASTCSSPSAGGPSSATRAAASSSSAAVAASPQVRAATQQLCDEAGVSSCLPPLRWSTDNGAMIGLAAWDYLARGLDARPRPDTSLTIADW